MAIITIVKGDRRRQCAEADFAHFAARGFEKAAVPAAGPEPAAPAQVKPEPVALAPEPATEPAPVGKAKTKKS